MIKKDVLENFKLIYVFFQSAAENQRPFTYKDIVAVLPSWKESTVRTYAGKKWREFLPAKQNIFTLDKVKFPFSESEFLRMMSQVQSKSSNPFKPVLPEAVEILVDKAKEAAVLAT